MHYLKMGMAGGLIVVGGIVCVTLCFDRNLRHFFCTLISKNRIIQFQDMDPHCLLLCAVLALYNGPLLIMGAFHKDPEAVWNRTHKEFFVVMGMVLCSWGGTKIYRSFAKPRSEFEDGRRELGITIVLKRLTETLDGLGMAVLGIILCLYPILFRS